MNGASTANLQKDWFRAWECLTERKFGVADCMMKPSCWRSIFASHMERRTALTGLETAGIDVQLLTGGFTDVLVLCTKSDHVMVDWWLISAKLGIEKNVVVNRLIVNGLSSDFQC